MTDLPESNANTITNKRRRFGMKQLLALPILCGLAIFVGDMMFARYLSGGQEVAFRFKVVDAESGDPIAKAVFTMTWPNHESHAIRLDKLGSQPICVFGINRRLSSRVPGLGSTDYEGYTVQVGAEGYQDWRAYVPDLIKDRPQTQKTRSFIPFLIRLRRTAGQVERSKGR